MGTDPLTLGAARLTELYQAHAFSLFKRARHLLGDEETAQEMVQEAFCQFWAGRSRFRGEAKPFTFLYRITTNLCIDRLRQKTRRGDMAHLDEAIAPDPRAGTDLPLLAASQLAHLTAGLDGDVIVVAVLAHVDGLTQDEIGIALGLSRRTVGKRLKRFSEHTRRRLGEEA